MSLLLIANVSSAQAGSIQHTQFFDFEYAKSLWKDIQTRDQLEAFYMAQCPNGGGQIGDVYDAWEADYRKDPQGALSTLKDHPQAEGIKKCYDLVLTNQQWANVYSAWRDGLSIYGGEGWNKNTKAIDCGVIKTMNIFTGQCNDLPDWRTPKGAQEDAANMAKGNAKWWSKKN